METDVDHKPEGQNRIYHLYALFGVSLILSVIPNGVAAMLSMVFFIVLLVVAYVMRNDAQEHSLLENHATFIIRTCWIVAVFSVITMSAASVYIFSYLDYAPFEPCVNQIAAIDTAKLQTMGVMELNAYAEPCLHDFINFNFNTLITATLIGAVPLLIYLAYRFVKGLSRAVKGYRLADNKGWF